MNEIPQAITAAQLVTLLESKHSQDLCVPECKDGPTQMGPGCLRLDFWAMPRSWAKPWVSAYEIKVSRNDFMRDDKWPGYLQYCNMFSFVCPAGLIQPEELSEGVGLYWASKNGSRLYCKRKPANRMDVEIPESLYRYILMCRTRIKREITYEAPMERAELEKWLQDEKSADEAVGQKLALAIARQVKARVGAIQSENDELKKENERLIDQHEPLATVKAALEELGVNTRYSFRPLVEDIRAKLGLPSYMVSQLSDLQRQIGHVLDRYKPKELEGE